MGGSRMQLAANVLNEARIPTFEYPDAAARSFAHMWRYSFNLRALYEAPVFCRRTAAGWSEARCPNHFRCAAKRTHDSDRYESKQILAVMTFR